MAILAKNAGVETFIHISALGASEDSPSEWARTKVRTERTCGESVADVSDDCSGKENKLCARSFPKPLFCDHLLCMALKIDSSIGLRVSGIWTISFLVTLSLGLVRFWPIIPLVCPNHRVAPLSVCRLETDLMALISQIGDAL